MAAASWVAAGAGVDVAEINRLLKQHRQMQDAFKFMAKDGGKGFARMAGMMGGGAMGPRPMMFALMDADSDGTVSLREFQAAHERIFKAMDGNKDGKLTLEEMQAFMHGTR